ncbi:MAG: hypothetical protein IPJ65_10330 [Archangiaceae bacterium]|nr:hypothetical protein [Archangiaceae bacterium]
MKTPATDAQVRAFGLFMFAVAAAAGGYGWRHGQPVERCLALAGAGAALWLASLAAPRAVRPLRAVWMGVGEQLRKVTTPLLLTVVFVGVLLPLRLLLALFRVDLLGARRGRSGPTYWLTREKKTLRREDFERLG